MTVSLLRADARSLPLPDASVDLICTSPPYWALRAYQDGGETYDGQIGSEPTPAEYVDSLIDCTREWMRVLKTSGSLWVNLGDCYYSGKGAPGRTTVDAKSEARTVRRSGGNPLDGPSFGIGRKSLIGLPWRYALRCIDDLGLILRAEVIWSKPNGLPESVTDRVRRSHEQWFHFVRSPRYFSAVDAIREAHSGNAHARGKNATVQEWTSGNGVRHRTAHGNPEDFNPAGKLPGSVWTVPSQPLNAPAELGIDHFAAFPMEWPRRLILGWSPSGICTACGEGRRPVVSATTTGRDNNPERQVKNDFALKGSKYYAHAADHPRAITGEACACSDASAPTRPAVVVDPFGGTGTTALVADALGRRGVSVDMSADYLRLARWRTTDPGQRAAALEVDKPPAQHRGQLDLFEVSA